MNELEELNCFTDNFNKGCAPLINWMQRHKNDPFFETEDGKDIMDHIGMIAQGRSLLNLKMSILLLQSVILEREASKEGEGS